MVRVGLIVVAGASREEVARLLLQKLRADSVPEEAFFIVPSPENPRRIAVTMIGLAYTQRTVPVYFNGLNVENPIYFEDHQAHDAWIHQPDEPESDEAEQP